MISSCLVAIILSFWLCNESQNGAIMRTDQRTGTMRSIRPPARPKDKQPYRFNWTAPISISPHNSRILYFGTQAPAAPAQARFAARMVAPGEYVVILEVGGQKWTKKAKIRPIPGLD